MGKDKGKPSPYAEWDDAKLEREKERLYTQSVDVRIDDRERKKVGKAIDQVRDELQRRTRAAGSVTQAPPAQVQRPVAPTQAAAPDKAAQPARAAAPVQAPVRQPEPVTTQRQPVTAPAPQSAPVARQAEPVAAQRPPAATQAAQPVRAHETVQATRPAAPVQAPRVEVVEPQIAAPSPAQVAAATRTAATGATSGEATRTLVQPPKAAEPSRSGQAQGRGSTGSWGPLHELELS